MGSGQSSVLVSEEGFHSLAENLSGIVATNVNSNDTQQQRLMAFGTLLNYYRVQGGLYPGSGKMMRTYRVVENRSSASNSSVMSNLNTRFGGGGAANTAATTTAQQTFQKNEQKQSAAVVKTGWILCKNETTNDIAATTMSKTSVTHSVVPSLQEHSNELQRVRDICIKTKQVHVVPYMRWFAGNEMKNIPMVSGRNATVSGPSLPVTLAPIVSLPPSSSGLISATNQQQQQPNQSQQYLLKPVYLIRPYIYTTLTDRLASRPFLQKCEKLFITYQLLLALDRFHTDGGLVHGFLTTENIGLTSSGWVVLMDITSYKCSSFQLPDNDPSEYMYYFQPQQHSYNPYNDQYNVNQQQQSSSMDPAQTSRSSGTGSEKRCYLAPERFYTPSSSAGTDPVNKSDNILPATKSSPVPRTQPDDSLSSTNDDHFRLSSAMDIFSLGCVLTELCLNGERCFDLGELMFYRRTSVLPVTVQQRLNKIESSTIRAACKHMLSIDPKSRLSAKQYYERLVAANQFPSSFDFLHKTLEIISVPNSKKDNFHDDMGSTRDEVRDDISSWQPSLDGVDKSTVPSVCPDARVAVAASVYGAIIWECIGIRDVIGEQYFKQVLGKNIKTRKYSQTLITNDDVQKRNNVDDELTRKQAPTQVDGVASGVSEGNLLLEVESMLRDLEKLDLENLDVNDILGNYIFDHSIVDEEKKEAADGQNPESISLRHVERSASCKSSIFIYLQILLSTIRHVQRPSTKLVALQLIDRVGLYCHSDEARLQRIVPVAISLIEEDQDPLVRAYAIHVLTNNLSIIQSFPPSDSKLFPQYIFKRVSNLFSDQSLIVRITFSRCLATLAETAHRFLDITHAVRLYEAVGNATSSHVSNKASVTNTILQGKIGQPPSSRERVFDNNVHKLLDDKFSRSPSQLSVSSDTSDLPTNDVVKTESSDNAFIINSTYSSELFSLRETVLRWFVHISTDQSENASLLKRTILQDLGKLCAFFGHDGVMSSILPHMLAFLNERKDWQLRSALFEHLPTVCYMIGRAASEEYVLPCVEIGLVDSEERVISSALQCLTKMVEGGMLSRSTILRIDPTFIDGKLFGRQFLRKYGVLLLFPAEDIRQKAIEAYVTICRAVGSPDCEVLVLPQVKLFFRFQPPAKYLLSADGMRKCLHPPWPRRKYASLLNSIIQMDRRELSIPGAWTTIGVSISEENDQAIETIQQERGDETPSNTGGQRNDPFLEYFHEYIHMLVRHNAPSSTLNSQKNFSILGSGIEGPFKGTQSVMFPRQNGKFQKRIVPEWYNKLRDSTHATSPYISEESSIQSIASLGQIYGLSIIGPIEGIPESFVDSSDNATNEANASGAALRTGEALRTEASFRGEWGAGAMVEPDKMDTCLLLPKLKALKVPPLPPQLGELGIVPLKRLPPVSKDAPFLVETKPRIKGLLATSIPNGGHSAPVVRLAMSKDFFFFVSASHDGSCRVWEIPQIDDSVGVLESRVSYNEHCKANPVRINDVAMLEGSHSVASAASDGSVHVWRVDMVRTETGAKQIDQRLRRDRARVVGCNQVRQLNKDEGEILCVSHFNSPSASIITYASQKGVIHSWDLRCAKEPYTMQHSPELGSLSSMALGNDLYWMVTGTSKGYLTLWDIRFQHPVQAWQHSRKSPITRLATSNVVPPQFWSTANPTASVGPKPYVFVSSGSNECSMFDVTSGTCSECFRTVALNPGRNSGTRAEELPQLIEVDINSRPRVRNTIKLGSPSYAQVHGPPLSSINCMVGSIGANANSYMVTGGSDSTIRFWDFWRPANCYVISRPKSSIQPKHTMERIDFDSKRRLMLCREMATNGMHENSRLLNHGNSMDPSRFDHSHTDSILDLKIIDNNTLVSCSRDCTIKVWR